MQTVSYQGFAIVLAVACSTLLALRYVFLPPHMRRSSNGKRCKMPPGPAGVPFWGNLLQYRHARRGEVEMRDYVR